MNNYSTGRETGNIQVYYCESATAVTTSVFMRGSDYFWQSVYMYTHYAEMYI